MNKSHLNSFSSIKEEINDYVTFKEHFLPTLLRHAQGAIAESDDVVHHQ